MRHRNSGVGGRGDSSGYSGHDLERNARVIERLGFFASAAEDQRITNLETHHPLALAGEAHEQLVDLILTDRFPAATAFPDAIELGMTGLPCVGRKQLAIGERIIDDGVGAIYELPAANGDQRRIARPRPHEIYRAGFHAAFRSLVPIVAVICD